jgi:hypothetical protein
VQAAAEAAAQQQRQHEAELARQMGAMAVGLPHGWVMQVLRRVRSPA